MPHHTLSDVLDARPPLPDGIGGRPDGALTAQAGDAVEPGGVAIWLSGGRDAAALRKRIEAAARALGFGVAAVATRVEPAGRRVLLRDTGAARDLDRRLGLLLERLPAGLRWSRIERVEPVARTPAAPDPDDESVLYWDALGRRWLP